MKKNLTTKIKKNLKYSNNILKTINNKWNKFIDFKYCKFIFKYLPQNLIIFLFFVGCIISFLNFNSYHKNKLLYNQPIADSTVEPIMVKESKISFDNVELQNNPEKFCLTFATYSRKNNSEYQFLLYENKNIIYSYNFNSSVLNDGEQFCFKIPEIKYKDIKKYSASIKPIYSDSQNAITYFKNSETNEATIAFLKKNNIISLKNIGIMISILIFLIINGKINTKKIKPELYWILISVTYTFLILFIIPPYQVPDEPFHFNNSYRLSQIDVSKPLSATIKNPNIIMPESVNCLNYSGIQKVDHVGSSKAILNCLKNTKNSNNQTYQNYISYNSKLGFTFSSLGIKIGDLITNSPVIIFYCGRIMNYLFGIILIFYSIKLIPKYKYVALSVSTIPMFTQEMCSYSYDSTLNTICILTVSLIIKIIFDQKINLKKMWFLLTICGIFIANIKMIYLPIFLLLLLMPNKEFSKKYHKYLYCMSIILVSYIINKYILLPLCSPSQIINNLITSSDNFKLILNNPFNIFSIAFYTIKTQTFFYLQSLFGYFGWFRFRLSNFVILSYIVYFIYLIRKSPKIKSGKTEKIIIIIGNLLIIAAIFASMYFSWTKPLGKYVDGVQGRYFLPILFPTLLMILNKNVKKDLKVNLISYYFINIIMLEYILLLLTQFY